MTDQSSFVDGLNDAIRDNPLAAALVGAGVFWMLLGAAKPFSVATASGAADLIKRNAESTAERVRSQSLGVATFAKENAREITEKVKDYYAEASETVTEGTRNAADAGRQYGSTIQESLRKNLESQPLLLGALGLAIGAGVASAFPAAKLENDITGHFADSARETIGAAAKNLQDSAISRGEKLMNDLKDEASIQGLTPADAREAWDQVATKVGAVTEAAKTSLKNNLQNGQSEQNAQD